MRNYLLASWLLFYDSTFRPRRFQQRLNEWLPPPKKETDTSWTEAILFPISRTNWWLLSLALPWWLTGLGLLWVVGWSRFSPAALGVLSLGLLLSGWGMTALWPNLGLLWPTLAAGGLLGLTGQWAEIVNSLSAWTEQLFPLMVPLSLMIAFTVGGGSAGLYWAARFRRGRTLALLAGGGGQHRSKPGYAVNRLGLAALANAAGLSFDHAGGRRGGRRGDSHRRPAG